MHIITEIFDNGKHLLDSIPAKLVYARNHSNRKDWVCFVFHGHISGRGNPSLGFSTIIL